MKPKKSHDEILEGLSSEDLYPPIAEDGSRRSALRKILDDLTQVEVTVSRIPDVPPEITKMVHCHPIGILVKAQKKVVGMVL